VSYYTPPAPDSTSTGLEPDIFERLPGEPAGAYSYFMAFCEMGPSRKIKDLAEKVKPTTAYLYRLSSSWTWADRCAAYDRDAERRVHADIHAQRVRVALMQLAVARGLLQWPARYLMQMDDTKLAAMTPTEIARWANTGSVLAKTPLGEPDQRIALGTVDEQGSFRPMASMSDAERRQELAEMIAATAERFRAGEVLDDEEALFAFLAIPGPRVP
jgi:hypothetical protein